MALTKIGTDGVKDDAVTSGKIPANAVGSSELADQSVSLDKLPHGTSSNNGKFLRANNGADPTFETVSTDLVGDTSPQLGADLDVNDFNIKNGTSLIDITDGGRIEVDVAGTEIVDINGNGVDIVGDVDMTGTLKIADAIEHKDDSNTKIRFPSNDEVTVETSGLERFRVTQAGDVRLLSQNDNNADTNVLYWRGGNSTQFANLARIYSKLVSNWGGELHFQVKDDDGSLSNNYRTALKIDSNGQVTKALNTSYCVRSATQQSWSNDTQIVFSNVDSSNYGFHNIGGHYNVSTGIFTAPVAGRYLFSMQYSMWFGSNHNIVDGHQLQLYINNTARHDYFLQGGAADGAEGLVYGSAILDLGANDNIRWKHSGYGGNAYLNHMLTYGYLIG